MLGASIVEAGAEDEAVNTEGIDEDENVEEHAEDGGEDEANDEGEEGSFRSAPMRRPPIRPRSIQRTKTMPVVSANPNPNPNPNPKQWLW